MAKLKVNKLTLKEFKGYFNKHYKSLCLFSNKYIEDIDVSKDIVQDVFVKVWENKIKFKNKNKIKSYLYTAVKNKSLDYLKSKHVKITDHLPIKEIEKLETESYFLREVLVQETSKIIEKAINTLPDRCAKVIKLNLKEFTNAQIASELSISINTVKAQKRIAYKKLRPLLRECYILLFFYLFL